MADAVTIAETAVAAAVGVGETAILIEVVAMVGGSCSLFFFAISFVV